jgi:hypothetical protein
METPHTPGICECGCGSATTPTKTGYRRFVAYHHKLSPGFGENHHGWKGGRRLQKGYVYVLVDGREVREHVMVAEKALGRTMPKRAVVHHVDGCKTNNVSSNLVICEDQQYHLLLHRRQKALAVCGDPNAHACDICWRYDRQDAMYIHRRGNTSSPRTRHKDCHAMQMKAIKARRKAS